MMTIKKGNTFINNFQYNIKKLIVLFTNKKVEVTTMTEEKLQKQIDELQAKQAQLKEIEKQKAKELKKKQRELRIKEKKKALAQKEKNTQKLAAIIRLFYSTKTDEEIFQTWKDAFEKHHPEKLEQFQKIVGKK